MRTLVVTKERRYGQMGKGKQFYAVSLGSCQLATDDHKDIALDKAWRQIQDVLDSNMHAVGVAVAVDGTVISCREYQTGCVETIHHRPVNGQTVRMGHGCSMGQLAINGKPVSLKVYLEHELERYNECVTPIVGVSA